MNFDKLWFQWAMEISSNLALYLKMLVLVTAIAVSMSQSSRLYEKVHNLQSGQTCATCCARQRCDQLMLC